ncbi:FSR family fosmidomycin resistance protein-like MFS transporter [Methanomicrobium sp. W14]|jgi:FSR family fosmidomycin resistance protein-like MFS transporter|uniref:MFS transporter n=1 Tax=Methanomicrobium sp. W14 TaxID=2817839 RepID=UPI001AE1F43B|nr:MFS transporter [Methanomicrobium sp. W14]MBP2133634.1 FSR family fosmidomycin resistance protein-like MFS transporter [Methanomicrobium sp. W14]
MEDNVRSILGLSVSHAVNDIYSPVLPAILPLLILQNGYSYFLAGLLVTAFNLTSSFTQPVIGWLYDNKGISIPVPVSILFSAFFMSFLVFVQHSYTMMMLFGIGAAFGHAFFHPSALGLVSRLAKGANRGKLTSLFVVGGNLGFAIGPLLAGFVVAVYGLNGIGLLFIPGLLMALALTKVLPKNFNKNPEVNESKHVPGEQTFPYLPITLLVVASAFRSWVIFASIAYLPTYLTNEGFSLVVANVLTSLMLIAGVIGQIIGATISDKYGRKEYTLFGLIAAIPPFILFLGTKGIISIIALVAFGYFLWSTFSVTVAMSHELAPKGTGTVSGLMLGLAVGAGGLGVAATGFVADLTSVPEALRYLLVPIIIALALFVLVPYPWKTLKQKAGKCHSE